MRLRIFLITILMLCRSAVFARQSCLAEHLSEHVEITRAAKVIWKKRTGLTPIIEDTYHFKRFADAGAIEMIPPTNWYQELRHTEDRLAFIRERLRELNFDTTLPEVQQLRQQLKQNKKDYAKAKINLAFSESSVELNTFIFSRHTNTGSYKHMGKKSALKPFSLKAKTSDRGIIKGLIPYDQSLIGDLSPRQILKYHKQRDELIAKGEITVIPYQDLDGKFVVQRGQKRIFTHMLQPNDKVIQILADKNKRPFTSDIDIFTFGYPSTASTIRPVSTKVREHLGAMNTRDHALIKKINGKFLQNENKSKQSRSIIQHGPEAFNPSPVRVEFPIRIYTPTGHILKVNKGPRNDPLKNIRNIIYFLRDRGFSVDTNPSWGF